MAALGSLAAAGIYIGPLRPLWRPWPPDIVKSLLGVAGFAATLAYLSYRIGQSAGYRSGAVAAKAEARNIAEGLVPAPAPDEAAATLRAPPNPPVPPPETPPTPPSL